MDNVNRDAGKPAPQRDDVDWYGFHQKSSKTPAEKSPSSTPADDPYGYHQGSPAKHDGQKPGHDGTHKPGLTLYDVAEHNMRDHHLQIKSQDDIYRHLNDMMVAHGHHRANLDGRSHLNDHMLPKEWNFVDPRSLAEHPHHPKLTFWYQS